MMIPVPNGNRCPTGLDTEAQKDSGNLHSERPLLAVIGSSGHARVVVDAIEAAGEYRIAGFLDSYRFPGIETLGYEIIGAEEDLPALLRAGVCNSAVIAIGDNWTRGQAAKRLEAISPHLTFVSVIHPSAVIAKDVLIGTGTVILAGAVVNVGARIGRCCILNTRSSLDHDSVMGDFSSLAPHAATGGGVNIGAFSAVAIGASVSHDVKIAEHTVVGAGATVLKDLPASIVAYGTPAKVIRPRQPSDLYLGERTTGAAAAVRSSVFLTSRRFHSIKIVPATSETWNEHLEGLPHDFFQTREYHELHERFGSGEAWLAVYEDGPKRFAWPYLKRKIDGRHGLPDSACDVSCTYGYTGPAVNDAALEPEFLRAAWQDLVNLWREQGVISVFTRFHPILQNHRLLADVIDGSCGAPGGASSMGKTVLIDLRQSEDEIVSGYSRHLRQSVRYCKEAGLRTEWDPEWSYLDSFVDLYYDTMKRNHAAYFYYFPVRYLRQLKQIAGKHGSLMVTKVSREIVSAAMLFEYDGIVSIHLLASSKSNSHLSPNKLTVHDVQEWARSRGNYVVHIGGGRGNHDDDNLFRFKALFAHTFRPFYTGRWVLDKVSYEHLSEQRRTRGILLGKAAADENYFPFYRAPFR